MKYWILLIMFVAAVGLSAVGFSFGPEFGFDFGESQIDAFDSGDDDDDGSDSDTFTSTQWRLHLMIDSNVSKYNLVNYRGKIGYGQIDRNYDSYNWDYTYDVISTEHSVGFGIVRRDNLRMWIGPSIQLDFMFFDEEESNDYGTLSTDSFIFGFGIGPTFGINIVPTSRFAIGMEIALKYKFEAGYIGWEYNEYDSHGYEYESWDDSSDILSDTYMITFKVFPMLLAGEY